MLKDTVRESVTKWFKENNIQVSNLAPKTIKIGKKFLEFDIYAEAEDKVYVDRAKVTSREKDVDKFGNKVALLRSGISKEVIPILIQ